MTCRVFPSLVALLFLAFPQSSFGASDMTLEATVSKTPVVPSKLQVGPSISFVSLPSIARAGIEMKYDRILGLSLDAGYMPGSLLGSDETRIIEPRVSLSVYPWRGRFFAGLGLGYTMMQDTQTKNGKRLSASANLLMISPRIGWRWVFDSGFFLATEFGISVCANVSVAAESDDQGFQKVMDTAYSKRTIADRSKKLTGTVMPYFTVLQIGWYL